MTGQERSASETHLLKGLVEALREPVLVISGARRIVAANAPARALFPALRGDEALPLVLRAPDVLDAVERVLGAGPAETTNWLERVPVERLFEVHVAPLVAAGHERAAVVTLRDLTDARRVERMRVDFIANASHELRTPLASLLGFIETLQGAARSDPVARDRFLSIMRDQGRRMARLIDDLLSLSHIEQQQHLRPRAPVDLVEVTRHCIDALTPMAQDAHTRLSLSSPERLIVEGDRDELVRVAENLIENAIKYGASADDREAVVDITLESAGGVGRLGVRDHGPGIAPEHLPRLTERFYRVDAGQSRAKGGTGLGLALVKHIVARHRGRLSIDSRLGEGATFRVELPLHAG